MTAALDTTVPTTFRSAGHQLGALASLAEGAGMDLHTVYSLANEGNLVLAVRRYQQRKTEQRTGETLNGRYAQRLLNLRAYDPADVEMTAWQRRVHLHMLRREGW